MIKFNEKVDIIKTAKQTPAHRTPHHKKFPFSTNQLLDLLVAYANGELTMSQVAGLRPGEAATSSRFTGFAYAFVKELRLAVARGEFEILDKRKKKKKK